MSDEAGFTYADVGVTTRHRAGSGKRIRLALGTAGPAADLTAYEATRVAGQLVRESWSALPP